MLNMRCLWLAVGGWSLLAGSAAAADERTAPELLLPTTPQPAYDQPVPEQIVGRVLLHTTSGIRPATGVSVSDGFSVATTDSDGRYRLRPEKRAVFVFLTRPSGADVVGNWYQPLADHVDFELREAVQSEEEFLFVHVTDTHVSQDPASLSGLSRFVREVNQLSPRPAFVINSGDLLNLHKALVTSADRGHADFRRYVGIMNHLQMPHYNVAGDHTDSVYRLEQFPRGDIRCGKPLYWEYLGPNFFSFEYGRLHFQSIDFGYHLGQKQVSVAGKLLEYPTNQLQPAHVQWMRQDLAARTQGTRAVTASEADLEDHCDEFADIAHEHDVRLQLVGDTHILTEKRRSVPSRTGGALAGCWWNPKTDGLCPDLSPQGYLIYRAAGDSLECFYKGLGQRIAWTSHRMGAVWQGTVHLEAHLVQPATGESLEYSVNGTDWYPMQETSRPFCRTVFAATVDSQRLNDGVIHCEIRSTSTGEVNRRAFVVANGQGSGPQADGVLTFEAGTHDTWTRSLVPSEPVDVLWNGEFLATVSPRAAMTVRVPVPADRIRRANVLTFRFAESTSGMTLSSPVLAVAEKRLYDLRDQQFRRVRRAHWGDAAEDRGGLITGNSVEVEESPFHHRQQTFCFVVHP